MSSQDIRDRIGQVIGRLKQEGSKQVRFTANGQKLAWCDENTNEKCDARGQKVSAGNSVISLL